MLARLSRRDAIIAPRCDSYEVNLEKASDLLRVCYDDVAALRRYLVNEGFLDRDGLEYWRAGGTIS